MLTFIIDGDLFLINGRLTKDFRNDGVDWVKKKGRDSVREDVHKLDIGGTAMVSARYTYSISNPVSVVLCLM